METKVCRCGAVRAMNDPKGQKVRFKTYKINFGILAEVINKGYACPEERGKICFCKEFLEVGECKMNAFEKLSNAL